MIYLWPDGTWCWEDESKSYVEWMGDDYLTVTPPEYVDDMKIDTWIMKTSIEDMLKLSGVE